MCCSLVDRRWHRAFILTRARVHIYSLGVGKVSYVSWDGSKAPGQRARVRSALAARGRRDQRRSPGISHLGLGLPLLPRLPGTRRWQGGWQITPVFWKRSLAKPLKRFIIYRQRDENMKCVHGGPCGEGQLLPGSNFPLKFLWLK